MSPYFGLCSFCTKTIAKTSKDRNYCLATHKKFGQNKAKHIMSYLCWNIVRKRSPRAIKSKHATKSSNWYYHSFKMFLRLWLVKTAHIIHHNQLLLTEYWTDDVKSAARWKLLNWWRQNDVKSTARCRLLNRWPRKPGDKVVLFWWAEKQRAKWRNSFKNREIFWMNNKQLLNSAFIEYGEFCRSRRVLSTSAFGLCG